MTKTTEEVIFSVLCKMFNSAIDDCGMNPIEAKMDLFFHLDNFWPFFNTTKKKESIRMVITSNNFYYCSPCINAWKKPGREANDEF